MVLSSCYTLYIAPCCFILGTLGKSNECILYSKKLNCMVDVNGMVNYRLFGIICQVSASTTTDIGEKCVCTITNWMHYLLSAYLNN